MSHETVSSRRGDMRFDFTAVFEKVPKGYIGYGAVWLPRHAGIAVIPAALLGA